MTRPYVVVDSKAIQAQAAQQDFFIFWFLILCLVSVGWLMMTSASLPVAARFQVNLNYFSLNQLLGIGFGLWGAWGVYYLSAETIQQIAKYGFLISIILLICLWIPGLGIQVNGSRRWLKIFFLTFQVSELVKLLVILQLASFLDRVIRIGWNRKQFHEALQLGLGLVIIGACLLKQPDFGSLMILGLVIVGLLFLGGVSLKWLCRIGLSIGLLLLIICIREPYRVKRLMAFWDPWGHQFDSGYQLTQALIGIGRGGVFGVGLGNSLQKMDYLPEPHTDFVFSIIAEELGLLGLLLFLGLLTGILYYLIRKAIQAFESKHYFFGFLISGWTLCLAVQILIHMGVNIGLLPTKGLIFPLVSYGRTNLIVVLMSFGMIYRISYAEN